MSKLIVISRNYANASLKIVTHVVIVTCVFVCYERESSCRDTKTPHLSKLSAVKSTLSELR